MLLPTKSTAALDAKRKNERTSGPSQQHDAVYHGFCNPVDFEPATEMLQQLLNIIANQTAYALQF
jgi:hypothetical protein